jgi:GTPase SAR1 family protein
MNYISDYLPAKGTIIAAAATAASSLWTKENTEPTILSNREILKIASIINSSYIESNLIDLPKLVVVGTQSSGKSSLLNALTGVDILPVGKSMTTRTPLHLELIQSTQECRVEFGHYNNCQWQQDKKIPITYPNVSVEQRDAIRNEIEIQTNVKAGTSLNISDKPIFIKIYASAIPNLSLIDLPGLTSVAITDRGQPADIKAQIIRLIQKYIEPKNTIILAVIAARPDIEADMAMEVVKTVDPRGERTLGILTKLDLMNEDSDIAAYLENQLSMDLKLKYGYYGIKNRSSVSQTIAETIHAEKSFFASHPVYRQDKYKSHLGITNLSQNLSSILISNIKQCLPSVLANINVKMEEVAAELTTLGSSIPADKDVRMTVLNGLISLYIKTFVQAIELRGSTIQTGRQIKEQFSLFRLEIEKNNPFYDMDDNHLVEILKCYDGIHMSFPYLPIEVLENCLRPPSKHRPIRTILEPAEKCLQHSLDLLSSLNQDILDHVPLKKYPNLIKSIRSVVVSDILMPRYQKTLDRIVEIIDSEESYIWTDDAHFQSIMTGDYSKIIQPNGSFDISKFKQVLYEYYKTVVRNTRESIPKAIVFHLIKSATDQLNAALFEKILSGDTSILLEEFPEIEERRRVLESMRGDLVDVKKLIETIV